MKKVLSQLLIFSALTIAQVNWAPTYNLSNTPSATSDYHSVHSDESGNYYVAWGDNGQIKFKYSSNFGTTWSANITTFFSSNTCGWPVVKADNNYVYLVYHQLAGNYEILFQVSTNYGQTWSPPEFLSGMDDGSITPQLAVSGTNIYAVWERRLNNYYDIFFRKSTDRGMTWSSENNISNSPGSHSRWVQLEAAGITLYCSWLESVTYPASDIYFSKSTDSGESWWLTPPNITNNERPQNRIYMKADGDNIYIVSDDIITFNFDEIYLMKSTDGGFSWSIPANITNNPGNSNTPCLEVWGDFLYFTWADNSHTAPAYDNMDIFFKWSSDGGVTWQDSINLSVNPEFSSRPRICSGINGPIADPWIELTIVWYDYSTGDAEILARRGNHFIVPVELISFEANVSGNKVQLNWATASEINNKGFEIQRLKSNDANWEIINFVNGKGTTTETQFYSYSDDKLEYGKYSYRLKQIDFDGSFEYSDIIEAEVFIQPEFFLSQNYPNPFNPSTIIKYSLPASANVQLKIYDILGRVNAILVNEFKEPGEYKVEWDAGDLAGGIYYYQLIAGDFIEAKSMILLR